MNDTHGQKEGKKKKKLSKFELKTEEQVQIFQENILEIC